MAWIAFAILMLIIPLGVIATVLTLPGVWLILLAAGGLQWWSAAQGEPFFPLWLLITAVSIALLGEILEFAASALGSKAAGGGRPAGFGAIIGAIVGAILGTPFLFPLGTIIGSALGAGLAAMSLEKGWTGSNWDKSSKVAVGAAVGRLVATVVKLSITGSVAVALAVCLLIKAVWG